MSRKLGMECINCRPTSRPGHIEYSMEYHHALIRKVAGANRGAETMAVHAAADDDLPPADIQRRFYQAWDYDLLWRTQDGLVDWREAGRCTDMGHAVYAADGSDRREPAVCPFSEPEEVWEFDPVKEYGITPFDELVDFYERDYQRRRAEYPDQVCTGGYYKTTISGAIQAFGWDMLLLAASAPAKFAGVIERFGQYTLHHARAWAETSIEVYIQHDDIVWTRGPFIHPEFYRQVIFPIYRELWKPLKAAGKKVLFCSDGTVDMFLEDIAEAGADGFIFEPCNDFERIVKTFGGSHCIIGSKVDCRTMTFESWDKVRKEIDATLALTRGLPGFFFAVGNHIPANVSDEMCLQYMAYLRENWSHA